MCLINCFSSHQWRALSNPPRITTQLCPTALGQHPKCFGFPIVEKAFTDPEYLPYKTERALVREKRTCLTARVSSLPTPALLKVFNCIEFVYETLRFSVYSNMDTAIVIIPSQNTRSKTRDGMSTFHVSAGPAIVLRVWVDQVIGTP